MSEKLSKKSELDAVQADVAEKVSFAEAQSLTSGEQLQARENIGLLREPVAVADATARKLAATYTAEEVTPVAGLKVIQTDLPDVVWELLDASDVTADANWAGFARTDANGSLPLAGVKLADGNFPFAFTRYIPVSSANWITVTTAKMMRLFEGVTIPGSLVQAGNKISVTGRVRFRKDSSGTGTSVTLTFQKAALFDAAEVATPTYDVSKWPQVALTDLGTTLEASGDFQAIYTLTAVTGSLTGELELVPDADLTDGGKIWSFTTSAYAALAMPLSTAVNSQGLATNITEGEDFEMVIGLYGGNNVSNKIYQIAITGGVNVFVP